MGLGFPWAEWVSTPPLLPQGVPRAHCPVVVGEGVRSPPQCCVRGLFLSFPSPHRQQGAAMWELLSSAPQLPVECRFFLPTGVLFLQLAGKQREAPSATACTPQRRLPALSALPTPSLSLLFQVLPLCPCREPEPGRLRDPDPDGA